MRRRVTSAAELSSDADASVAGSDGAPPPLRGVPDSGYVDLSTLTDAELVEKTRHRSNGAAKVLYRRHRKLANGLAYRLLGRDDELDDVVQEAFLRAYRGLDRLLEPQAFASWLASIVVRCCHRRLSRRRWLQRVGFARGEPLDVATLVAPDAPPDVVQRLREVYAVIDRLPVEERTAVVLRRVEGYTMPQVAELMGVSLTTAKRRLRDAEVTLEKLR